MDVKFDAEAAIADYVRRVWTRLCGCKWRHVNWVYLLTYQTNKSSRTAPTSWITTEILSLKSARRRLDRTYIASLFFYLKLLRSATNRYHKFKAAAKSHSMPHLSSLPQLNLELFGKLSITSYTELQIAPSHIFPADCPTTAICHTLL